MCSRRRFLGATALGSLALAARARGLGAALTERRAPRAGCAALDLGAECALPESLAGWAAAGARLLDAGAAATGAHALVVLPGVVAIPRSLAGELLRHARAGATVVIESGAVFGDAAAVAAHRESMRSAFGVDVAPPVPLWPRPRGGVPYVEYSWPLAARVRDFSRAIPVDPRAGDEVVARADGLAVALRRREGAGTLLFLGSPLGAALGAGDAEARRWVDACAGAPAAA